MSTKEAKDEEQLADSAIDVRVPSGSVLSRDFVQAKQVLKEKRREFIATATRSEAAPVEPVVKALWSFAALAVVLLVLFVGYSLLRTQSNDTVLEDSIMSGDRLESLKVLRQHSIQNLSTTFIIVIGMLVLTMFAVFGYLLYSKDTQQHQSKKQQAVVLAATTTFSQSDDITAQLVTSLELQKATVETLKHEVDLYTKEIEKLNKEGCKSREKMEQLTQQKAKKEAALAAAEATLKVTQESLDEGKTREEGMRKDLRNKEETIRAGQREAVEARAKVSNLEGKLRSSESDASSLRSRARYLEQAGEQYRSRAQYLEVETARLTEEVKRKPSRRTTWVLL
jgi:hypothetical protein